MPGEKRETEMVEYRPMRDIERVMDEMEETFQDIFGRPFFPVAYSREPQVRAWSPATEIFDNVDSYIIRLEVPGVSRDDINITATEDSVTIAGNRKTEEGIKREDFTLCERCYGPFERILTFETPIDSTGIQAWLENGILRLQVPIVPEAMGKKIEIGVGAPQKLSQGQTAATSEMQGQTTTRYGIKGEPVSQGKEVREIAELETKAARGELSIREALNVKEKAARLFTGSNRPEQSKGESPTESESNARQSRTKPTTKE